jgi:hypothetical protein
MTYSRRASALGVLVVAMILQGCAYVVSPDTQAQWADRLAAAETTIQNNRLDIEAAAGTTRANQIALNSALEICSEKDVTAGLDARYNEAEIQKYYQAQIDALDRLKDVGQDLALLRDEIEEGGF